MTDDNKASEPEPSKDTRIEATEAGSVASGGSSYGLITVLGSGGVAAVVKYGSDVAKTALTERGKTRREQLNQAGQTDRARIAAASDSPAPAEPDDDGQPDDAQAAPGGAA
ncbi:hypothetical protein [Streptomyces sp. NPDC127038]|uniref:hypothetical protein n=1 Tax=Streptomyces sp. NPDC127038 TaxID=3347114 RepID=UPI00364BABE7